MSGRKSLQDDRQAATGQRADHRQRYRPRILSQQFAREAAGADMLYAPGVHDLATIKTVVSALKKPFNLLMSFADPTPVEQPSTA
jgi:2-methylisocitrate lyase-like PEP mutase family enzyme